MLTISDLSLADLHWQLNNSGLAFRCGPFTTCLHSDLPDLPAQIHHLHACYPILEDKTFCDFHVRLLCHGAWWRRWWRPQLQFWIDDEAPFEPFPQDTALPFLEWGLNWCVATRAHHYLMLHAGALEKNGNTLLLPAHPGSGKSTLTAALCHRGWRLLTDETVLVQPVDLALIPFPRLIPLKNEAIAVFRAFVPEAVLGPEYSRTRKGTVCHVRPPAESIERSSEIGQARWIVFPRFESGAPLSLGPLSKMDAFTQLTRHSFNYKFIGLCGFQAMTGLIDACDCYTFEYGGDLEQAVAQLNALADGLI